MNSLKDFEALKPDMDAVRVNVKNHLKDVHLALLSRRAEYDKQLAQLSSQETALQGKIKTLEDTKETLSSDMATEVRSRDDSTIKVREMQAQEEELTQQRGKLRASIAELEVQIAENMKKVSAQRTKLANQSAWIQDKTFQYEELLGVRIETGGGDNLLRFVFKNVDPEDFSREVDFVFNPETYSVVETHPSVDTDAVDRILDSFKREKEIGYLWRDMRDVLRKAL